jgi:hypothetical protein
MNKGTINESSTDILDTTIDGGAFWTHCILAHDQAHADELIPRSAKGLDKVGNCLILPRLLVKQTWGSPSHCKVSVIGDDEEDEAKLAINALATHLTKISNLSACSVTTPASITTPGNLDELKLDSIEMPGLPSLKSHPPPGPTSPRRMLPSTNASMIVPG